MTTETRSDLVVNARWLAPAGYVCAVGGCNVVAVTVGPVAGAVCSALVVLGLLNTFALAPTQVGSRPFLLLALVPLVRVISLAMPASGVSPIARDALVSSLLLVALWLADRVTPLDWTALAMRWREAPAQLLIAAAGVPLGILGEQILTPHPIVPPHDAARTALAVVVLGGLTAPSLEILFRWALQPEMFDLYGGVGLGLLNALFASMYLGTHSAGYVVLMGATGLGLAIAVRRTGRIWGAIGAHAILVIGVLVLWPTVL